MQVAMLAAGFSAGEADQLRRAMAAWKRKGGLEPYHERLVNGMLVRGYDEEFAEAIFAQIKGFGDYGFPESHAASFALLVYASAWLRRHEPAVFLAALLNSQPMGFYTPSQLIQDARRRGVQVLPVDVTVSSWDSTLEGDTTAAPVRVGMSLISGMRVDAAERIQLARAVRPFVDVADLARRAALDRHDLAVLAHAGALRSLAKGHRCNAIWMRPQRLRKLGVPWRIRKTAKSTGDGDDQHDLVPWSRTNRRFPTRRRPRHAPDIPPAFGTNHQGRRWESLLA